MSVSRSANELAAALEHQAVIPLIQAEDPATGVATAQALAAAGMRIIEVVQRTDASLESLEAITAALPDAVIGAGTVLSAEQAETCLSCGARFIVSPGLDADIVATAQQRGADVFPGIMTPSELQHAHRLGLGTVKFFPATVAGGVGALKALASVFRDMRFIPTGGISAANLADFLALPAVVACGGSWLTPKDAIDAGDYTRITSLAQQALRLAATAKGN